MIRVGLLLNSYKVSAGFVKCIRAILALDFVKIELIVLNAKMIYPKAKLSTFLQRRYLKLDRHFHKNESSTVDLSGLLANIPAIQVEPETAKHVDTFNQRDIDEIKSYNLDVLFRFGFRILHGEILNAAKHGIWSLHHGDNRIYRGGPPFVWEWLYGEKVTGQVLQRLTEDLDGGQVLARASTRVHCLSFIKTQAQAFKISAILITKVLYKLQSGKFEIESGDYFYDRPLFKAPTNFKFLRLAFRSLWSHVKTKARDLFCYPYWYLLYAPAGEKTLYRFNPLIPSRRTKRDVLPSFWADPFLFVKDGVSWIFFENFDYMVGRGLIAAGPLQMPFKPQVALVEKFHLSYPFIFEFEGQIYLMPCNGNGELLIYRSIEFPSQWKLLYRLNLDEAIYDFTLFEHAGLWWLFGCDKENTCLYLYFATSPLTNIWLPHSENPVVIDPTCARSAGKIFIENGKILRPAQDCSSGSGTAVNFREIVELTSWSYKEKPYSRINPSWDKKIKGVHTFNRNENFVVMDALQWKII